MTRPSNSPLKIAVIGSGISGLSAAWLLAKSHDVTVFEKDRRFGGHAHTVGVATDIGNVPVDMGFIVYNPVNYPNLVSLFRHLDVATKSSNMSFSVSLDEGAFEYAGNSVASLFAQKRNLLRPRFWSMLQGILRFYREARRDLAKLDDPDMTLGAYLRAGGYGKAFERDHLLPMAGAIWSAPPKELLDYPARSFIAFFANHGLLELSDRPEWRTVAGGSRRYVVKLAQGLSGRVRPGVTPGGISRDGRGVSVRDESGTTARFDRIIIATHADQALTLLGDPSPEEKRLLGAFRYSRNIAVLHSDADLMPRRKSAWSSWNYLGETTDQGSALCVTYWMNALQGLPEGRQLFVTLNPFKTPRGGIHHEASFEHPVFNAEALRAQAALADLQGKRNTWFCGAHFGAGFHEDGLVSGLDAAESAGGVVRPWAAAAAPRLARPRAQAIEAVT